jgi:hypothetical protein
MSNILRFVGNPTVVTIFHVFIVAPLLYAIAVDKFPNEWKKYLIVLAVVAVVYHLYRYYYLNTSGKGSAEVKEGLHDTIMYDHPVHRIGIFDSPPGYSDPVLRIRQGHTVIWTNLGELEHTVTATTFEFDSGYLKPGQTFSLQFNNRGIYYYYCRHHDGWMRGMIVVD